MKTKLFILLLLTGFSADSQHFGNIGSLTYPSVTGEYQEEIPGDQLLRLRMNDRQHTSDPLRSAAIKYRLDSIVSTINEKYVFSYSGTGNPDSQIRYYANGQPIELREFIYDTGGKILLNTKFFWDNTGQVWIPEEKTESGYTATGKVEETIISYWYTNLSQWQPGRKTNYFYDAADMEILRDVYDWDLATGTWMMKFSYATAYNASGQVLEQTVSSSNFPTNIMELNYRYDYYYNVNTPSFTDSILGYTYNQATASWTYSSFMEYIMTNPLTGDYISISYSYIAAIGLLPQWKYEVFFDTAGNVIDQSQYMWLGGFPNWKPLGRTTGTFDNSVPVTDLYIPPDYTFKSKYILRTVYARGVTSFTPLYDFIYYWTPLTTGLAESGQSAVKVFPNPASDVLNMQTGMDGDFQFSIRDINGRMIYEQVINGNATIDISRLSAGAYHWQLTGVNSVQTGKLIKVN